MEPVIRLSSPDDAAQIAAIYAPFCESSVVSFEFVAPSAEVMAGRISAIVARLPWLVLEQGREVAGYVYASPHRERAAYQWSVDVTAYVADGWRRRGVGRALYTALFRILALQGYFKAYAGVTLPNPASVGLHEAVGFQPVGIYRGVGHKFGAWHDVAWYQRPLQPERPEPEPARAVREVLATDGWDAAVAAGLVQIS